MAVIVDCCADKKYFSALEKMNIEYYKSQKLNSLSSPVDTHPDMQIHFVSDDVAVVAPSLFDYYQSILPKSVKLYKGSKDLGRAYPEDCAYNVARFGKRVIGNLNFVDSVIKDLYLDLGYELINTKQGYAKCNLCIVDENSVITEDEGLFKLLSGLGVSVLKISPGNIKLEPYEYGFIGGASGLIKKNQLAFFGDISNMQDFEQIKKFLDERDVEPIFLSDCCPEDYGSILNFKI